MSLADQRRLAGAVRTDHRMNLAVRQLEVEMVSRHDATEALK